MRTKAHKQELDAWWRRPWGLPDGCHSWYLGDRIEFSVSPDCWLLSFDHSGASVFEVRIWGWTSWHLLWDRKPRRWLLCFGPLQASNNDYSEGL